MGQAVSPAAVVGHRNEVVLTGRLAAAPAERTLPSGDRLLAFRLVVDRPPDARAPRLDTLDCVAWRPALIRSGRTWRPGDVVEVSGALRRRFWRAGGTPVSRCEVEVVTAKRVRRVSTRPEAGRAQAGRAQVGRAQSGGAGSRRREEAKDEP